MFLRKGYHHALNVVGGAAHDKAWGEEWLIFKTEKKGGNVNARSKVIVDEAPIEICAMFEHMHQAIRNGHSEVSHSTREPYLFVHRCETEFRPKQGWIAKRCLDNTEWDILDTKPDGQGGIYIQLSQRGKQI